MLLSLLRLVPYFVVGFLLIAGWRQWRDWQQDRHDQDTARALLAGVGNSQDLSSEEAKLFWRLAGSSENVRIHFLRAALQPGNAERFNRRSALAVQATVQLSPELRRRVFREVFLPRLKEPFKEADVAVACVALGRELEVEIDGEFALPCARAAADKLLLLVNQSFPYDALVDSVRTVEGWWSGPEAEEFAEKVAARLLQTLLGEGRDTLLDTLQVNEIEKALQSISVGLPESSAAQLLHELWKKIGDRDPWIVSLAARALAGRLSENTAREFAKHLLNEFLQETEDFYTCADLATTLTALAGQLPREETQQIAQQVTRKLLAERLKALKGKRRLGGEIVIDTEEYRRLERALQSAGGQLSQEEAWKVVELFLKELQQKETSDEARANIAEIIQVLAGRVAKAQAEQIAQAVADQFVAVIEKTHGFNEPAFRLDKAQEALKGWLSPEKVREINRSVSKFRTTLRPAPAEPLQVIEKSRRARAGPLSQDEARSIAVELLKELPKMHYPSEIVETLHALAGRLSEEDARQLAQQVAGQFLRGLWIENSLQVENLDYLLPEWEWCLDPSRFLDLLKHPLLVGRVRTNAVQRFNARFAPDAQFNGKRWKLVAWIQKNRPDLDLNALPQHGEQRVLSRMDMVRNLVAEAKVNAAIR